MRVACFVVRLSKWFLKGLDAGRETPPPDLVSIARRVSSVKRQVLSQRRGGVVFSTLRSSMFVFDTHAHRRFVRTLIKIYPASATSPGTTFVIAVNTPRQTTTVNTRTHTEGFP